MQPKLRATVGIRTTLLDGGIIRDTAQFMATDDYYYADAGTTIQLLDSTYLYAVATYSLERDMTMAYEYKYLPDGAWVRYNYDLTPDSYGQADYQFVNSCYYRICIKRQDGADLTEQEANSVDTFFQVRPFVSLEPPNSPLADCFYQEQVAVCRRVEAAVEDETEVLKLILLTDTHYLLNGTWPDTTRNVAAMVEKIQPQAIVHLGDLTDGTASKRRTLTYANRVLGDLKANRVPVWLTLGNHDANYFRNNPEVMTITEQSKAYLEQELPYYYQDLDKKQLRLIFLHSYDNENIHRYGFLDTEVNWLAQVLADTPSDWQIILFCHDAPLAEMDYWADRIYNGDKIIGLLEQQSANQSGRIVAYIHGHSHSDHIDRRYRFPIVSIGCNKFEDFKTYKPEGFVTPDRRLGYASQELFDIMLYDRSHQRLAFIRFGAGEDRIIDL